MSVTAPLAGDAALVLGIASTAIPFARTREDEAECWLRMLRLYGEAGVVLQALGVGEGRVQLHEGARSLEDERSREEESDPVDQVAEEAARIAGARASSGLTTADLLLAVMCVYDEDFDRALQAHGTGRDEVSALLRERLSSGR